MLQLTTLGRLHIRLNDTPAPQHPIATAHRSPRPAFKR